MTYRAHGFRRSAAITMLVLGALMSRRVAAQPAAEMSGQWQGVYFAYPDVMRLDVDLRGPASALEGVLRFAPLDERRPNALGVFKGSYRVTGTFDARTRTFSLAPGAWVEPPRLMATPLAFAGVLSPDSRAAAGIFPKAPSGMNPHFALARPSDAKQMLLDPAGKLYGDAVNRPSVGAILGIPRLPGGGGGGDLKRVAEWASMLTEEYPQMDVPNTAFEAVYQAARPLFADSYFVPHFGKPFDQMSSGDRRKYAEALQRRGRGSADEEALRSKYGALERAFLGSGQFAATDVGVATLSLRIIAQWRDDAMDRLATMPLEEASLARLDAFDQTFEQLQVSFLPSERLRLSKAVDDGRVRVAVPAMNASLDGVLRGAAGYDGAVALGVWEGQHAKTLDWVPDATRTQMRARIDAKLDPLLAMLMEDELKAIGKFGRGRDAVVAGQKWFVNFKGRYAFALARPAVTAAVARILEQRQRDLVAAERVLDAEVDAEKTDAGLDRLATTYLVYPEDGRTAAGSALDRRIGDRRVALNRERYLAENFSANERKLMDGRGAIVVPAGYASSGPAQLRPSEEDVRMAIIRAFVGAGGRRLGPGTVTYGNVLFGGFFDLEIDVKTPMLEDRQPVSGRCGEALNPAGFCVTYQPNLVFRPGRDAASILAGSVQGNVLDGMLAMANNSALASRVDDFVLTPQGWISPSFQLELRARNMSLFLPVPGR